MYTFKGVIRGAIPVLMVLAGVVIDMDKAEAIPAFARQTSQTCTACHTQHFPTLNSFGRLFKAQGYTMGGSQETVQGEGLDLPGALNAALVGTLGIQNMKDNKAGTSEKAIGFPASLSLYFGGRIGTNSGFLVEMPFEGAAAEVGGVEGEVHPEAGPSIAQLGSLKWNYVKDMSGINTGLNAFSSSMAGPAYGYELLSTGALGMNVAITGANAMGAIGLHMEHGTTLMTAFMDSMASSTMPMRMNMAGQATGLGASAQSSEWFVYYSAYFGAQAMDAVADPSFGHYLRAVWTPSIAGWDLGIGTQIYAGSFGYGATGSSVEYDAKANTFDFQAQGDIAGRATGIYITYATAPKSSAGKLNWYNFSEGGSNASYGILCEMEVISRLSLNVGYTSATYWVDVLNGSGGVMGSNDLKGNLAQLGANYLLAPNKRLGFKYANFGGADLDSNTLALDLTVGF